MEGTRYRLSPDRTVELVRMHVDRTYAGLLEGTRAAATPHVLAATHEDVARLLPPGRPLLIIRDGTSELPPYRLIAELQSRRAVSTTDPDWASRLFICWFVEELEGASIDALVQSVLRSVNWETHAEDFDATLL